MEAASRSLAQPSDAARRSLLGWSLLLVLFAVLLRLPSFFVDVIDGDESAFILIGQALAEGHLPYTLAWDNKPPLAFLFYAAAVLVVPDSLAFIRFCGAGLVAASALLTLCLSLRLMPRREAVLTGFLTAMAMSLLISSALAVMLEHIAMLPLLAALLLLTGPQRTGPRLLVVGALLGVATLVRSNLALAPLAVVAALLLCGRERPWRQRLAEAGLVAAGGLAIALLSYLPYALTGRSELFFRSVLLAPLVYSSVGMGIAETALALAGRALPEITPALLWKPPGLLQLLFWLLGTAGLFRLALDRGLRGAGRPLRFWVLLLAAAAFLSMLLSARPWSHYLLQVAPFFAIGLAYLIARFPPRVSRACTLAFAVLLFTAMPLPKSYLSLLERARSGSPYTGTSFEVADYLNSVAAPQDSLFVTRDILVYWLTGRYPVIPAAAFPGNLWSERSVLQPLYGPDATTEGALQQVLCHAPTRILVPSDPAERGLAAIEPLRSALSRDYLVEAELARRTLYRRIETSPPPPCPYPEDP